MFLKALSILAVAATLAVLAMPASQAATADSILANKRAADANGCRREWTCVAWAKGAPGTFAGRCTHYARRLQCPINVR
jgi:hypothetical protein